MVEVTRLTDRPIVSADPAAPHGTNVNGPSLIRVPEWIDEPLGAYYLYFAHHQGESIRLAYADELTGPWQVHRPGTLQLPDSHFDSHIASPDVHVDHDTERIRMYYHGCCGSYAMDGEEFAQASRVAQAPDGMAFTAAREVLGRSYFRVFEYDGAHYALARGGVDEDPRAAGVPVYRSADGLTDFVRGPTLLNDGARHTATRIVGETLVIYYSRVGDAPERILRTTVDLREDWRDWRTTPPETILEPEREYEGASLPVEPSENGAAHEPVCQLRDPAIYREDDRTYLVYSVAGERGLALAELTGVP